LNNILRHSRATEAYSSLTSSQSTIRAVIEDNGVGFVVDDVLSPLQIKSLGLMSMRETGPYRGRIKDYLEAGKRHQDYSISRKEVKAWEKK